MKIKTNIQAGNSRDVGSMLRVYSKGNGKADGSGDGRGNGK